MSIVADRVMELEATLETIGEAIQHQLDLEFNVVLDDVLTRIAIALKKERSK